MLSFAPPASIEGPKSSLAFSLDDTLVYAVTEGLDTDVPRACREWDADPEVLASVCAAAGRDLSAAKSDHSSAGRPRRPRVRAAR